jgi:hypothetical protein
MSKEGEGEQDQQQKELQHQPSSEDEEAMHNSVRVFEGPRNY